MSNISTALLARVRAASEQDDEVPPALQPKPRKRSRFISIGADMPVEPQTERPLVGAYHARGFVTETVSASNVGKSQLIALEALAIVCERHDLMGEATPFRFPGGIVIISNEDGAAEVISMRNALMKTLGLTVADFKHPLIINAMPGTGVLEKDAYGNVNLSPEIEEDLRDAMADHGGADKFAGIYVDTRAASFGSLEENSATDMAQAYAQLSALAQRWHVFTDLLTHETKKASTSGEDPDLHSSRGSTAAAAGARYQRNLKTASAKDAPGMSKADRRDWVRVTSTKTKSGRVGASVRWFNRQGVIMQTKAAAQTDPSVVQPGEPDDIGILTYSATGPASSAHDMINDLLVVADAEAKGRALPVSEKAKNSAAKALGGDDHDAGKNRVSAMAAAGLIEKRMRPGGRGKPDIEAWHLTEAGHAAVKERKTEVLEATNEE